MEVGGRGGAIARRWVVFGWLACGAVAPAYGFPTLEDPALTVEQWVIGIDTPTTMAFVAPGDFLILEKKTGRVRRVTDGQLDPTPALDLAVANAADNGLVGIAVNHQWPPAVFLYYTVAASDGGTALGNRLERYVWNPQTGMLEAPVVLLELPVDVDGRHNGGAMAVGPPGAQSEPLDGALLYVTIGDLDARNNQLENFAGNAPPDDTSVIFRIRQDGTPAADNPFTPYCSDTTSSTCTEDADCPVSESCVTEVASYYAYGVRNSFGLAIDPLTGALWDTENGPQNYDEVNLVEPGTNSGWEKIMGPDARDPEGPGDLWDVPGAGSTYSDPEFSWLFPIAPTGIAFPVGSTLGRSWDDFVLVGDVKNYQIYALPLNGARNGFALSGDLADGVADTADERDALRFGSGFGIITDLEMGPDGALYVVSYTNDKVYRITGPGRPAVVPAAPRSALWGLAVALALTASVLLRRA